MAARPRRAGRAKQYASPAYTGLQKRLAENVRKVRKDLNLTQEEAAYRCGMSTRLLQMVEAGDVNVTLTTIARLTEGLAIDVLDLLGS